MNRADPLPTRLAAFKISRMLPFCIFLPVVLAKVFEYARVRNQPEQTGSE